MRRRRRDAAARPDRQDARRQARRRRRQGAAAGRARRLPGARRGRARAHLRDHARLLRKHVKPLADKAYWAGLDSAPDFVVMFLPGEHLYGAALEADPTLIEDAMARRVLIATPTTLLAMLRAVGYGWQQERVAESAQAISELGRELHAPAGQALGPAGHARQRGSTAPSRAYNETVGSYEARVLPGARRFADHGAVADGPRAAPSSSTSRSAPAACARPSSPGSRTTTPPAPAPRPVPRRADALGESGGRRAQLAPRDLRGTRTSRPAPASDAVPVRRGGSPALRLAGAVGATLPTSGGGPRAGGAADRPRACAPGRGRAPRR